MVCFVNYSTDKVIGYEGQTYIDYIIDKSQVDFIYLRISEMM
jgi:hypothetical protein